MSTKIELKELIQILNEDVITKNSCIEINFCVDNDEKNSNCWLGKMPDKSNLGNVVFWYGLVKDGSEVYDYNDIDEFLNAKVFNGKSLIEIFKDISFYAVDGIPINERLSYYLDGGRNYTGSIPVTSTHDTNKIIKHSKLGILAFIMLLSTLGPVLLFVFLRYVHILYILNKEQIASLCQFLIYYFLAAPVIGLILSIIDLRLPNRRKTLPRLTLILSSVFIGIVFIIMVSITIYDIRRLFS